MCLNVTDVKYERHGRSPNLNQKFNPYINLPVSLQTLAYDMKNYLSHGIIQLYYKNCTFLKIYYNMH